MPETTAAVAAYFGGTGAAAVGTEATLADVGFTAGAVESAGAVEAGAIGTGTMVAGGTTLGTAAGTAAANAAAGGIVNKLLTPKPPGVSPVASMPDPLAQDAARRRSIVEQLARRGRASTVLTDPATGGKLGG